MFGLSRLQPVVANFSHHFELLRERDGMLPVLAAVAVVVTALGGYFQLLTLRRAVGVSLLLLGALLFAISLVPSALLSLDRTLAVLGLTLCTAAAVVYRLRGKGDLMQSANRRLLAGGLLMLGLGLGGVALFPTAFLSWDAALAILCLALCTAGGRLLLTADAPAPPTSSASVCGLDGPGAACVQLTCFGCSSTRALGAGLVLTGLGFGGVAVSPALFRPAAGEAVNVPPAAVPPAGHCPPVTACYLPPAACCLPFAICRLPSAVCRLLPAACCF